MIQLDLLVGRDIYDCDGKKAGTTGEIMLRRHGRHYEVEGLIVGIEGWAERMDIAAPFYMIVRALHISRVMPGRRFVRWDQIARITDRKIELHVPAAQLESLDDHPPPRSAAAAP